MSFKSDKSVFSSMSITKMIKNAINHPSVEQHKKISLDFVENNTRNLSEIMNTCNGRDKLLAIIQYSCGIYVQCLKKTHTDEETEKLKSYTRSKRVNSNLSSGRKVFRLLKFSDELSSIVKHARRPNNNNKLQEIMFYSAGTCSFFFYLLDNIIWLSSKRYKLLGRIKDLFSLARCVIEIFKSLYELINDFKKEDKILKKLGLYDECFITETEESYQLIKELIYLRRQMSFYVLELITSVLRVFMLYKSLKFYGAVYMDPIFIEVCGVLSSFCALVKAVKRKSFEKKKQQAKEKKAEKPKRVEFFEEEKKSSNFFNLQAMSVDDSDGGEEFNEPNTVKHRLTKGINRFKQSVSSTHDITQSNISNNKLKQVKSTINVNR